MYRRASEVSGDAVRDVAGELQRRIGTLRNLILIPFGILSIAVFGPVYWLYREHQITEQVQAGMPVIIVSPFWTAAVSMVPVGVLLGLTWLVYRGVRGARTPAWKRELSAKYGLSSEDIDELDVLFH